MRYLPKRNTVKDEIDGQVSGRFHLGQIVRILRGRTAGKYAIVTRLAEPSYVWLADGNFHKAEHPKKKNVKHIQPTNRVVQEIADALNKNGCVENARLRYALNQYQLPLKENLEGE